MRPQVLAFAATDDPHIAAIEESLARRGVDLRRLDVDRIPFDTWARIAVGVQGANARIDGTWATDFCSVLYRRLSLVRSLRLWRHLPEAVQEFAMSEAEAALLGICGLLSHKPWINHFSSIHIASVKPTQLSIASSVGLEVPDTIITNDPDVVREFYERHDARIIFKPVAHNIVRSDAHSAKLIYTNRVARDHLEHEDLIRATPGIYQVEIEREFELRVTYVDGAFWAARVVSGIPDGVDWRRGLSAGTSFSPYMLDSGVANLLTALMTSLDLRYGAMDLIVRPDGSYVFLEVNPQGAYLWLEEMLGWGVTEAMADALLTTSGV